MTSPVETRRERLANTARCNMAAMAAILRQLQEKAENSSWENFLLACENEKKNLGPMTIKEPKFSECRPFKVDFDAQQLVPADELVEFVPVSTVGDGSCCFRAISTLVNGDESLHEELRLRTVVEIALNEGYYLADEDLSRRITAQVKVFNISGCPRTIDASVLEIVYREEARQTCKLSTYASFWHLQALANVVKRRIKSVYPETTPEVGAKF